MGEHGTPFVIGGADPRSTRVAGNADTSCVLSPLRGVNGDSYNMGVEK